MNQVARLTGCGRDLRQLTEPVALQPETFATQVCVLFYFFVNKPPARKIAPSIK